MTTSARRSAGVALYQSHSLALAVLLAFVLAFVAAPAPVHAGVAVASDDTVVVFPTLAARDGDVWVVPVRVWVGELEPHSLWRRGAVKAIRKLLRPRDGRERQTLEERARLLLADDQRGKRVTVRAGGVEVTLPPTDRAGHAHGTLRVPVAGGTDPLALSVVAAGGPRVLGEARLVPPDGVLVITDVDDTVRVSEVRDLPRLLRRTMLMPFEPVPGMAALLAAYAGQGAGIAYVTAMPSQLGGVLATFLGSAGFPPGELALRELADGDRRALRFHDPPETHKRPVLAGLLARFPRRAIVLVGDSGERDPEIYGELARAHPGRVAAILIREPPGAAMDDARRAQAFAGVTAPIHVFADPATLPAAIRAGRLP